MFPDKSRLIPKWRDSRNHIGRSLAEHFPRRFDSRAPRDAFEIELREGREEEEEAGGGDITLFDFEIERERCPCRCVAASFSSVVFENIHLHNEHVNCRYHLHFAGRGGGGIDKLYSVIGRSRHLSQSLFLLPFNVTSSYVAPVVNLCKRSDSLGWRNPIQPRLAISCSMGRKSPRN